MSSTSSAKCPCGKPAIGLVNQHAYCAKTACIDSAMDAVFGQVDSVLTRLGAKP